MAAANGEAARQAKAVGEARKQALLAAQLPSYGQGQQQQQQQRPVDPRLPRFSMPPLQRLAPR